MPKKQQEKQIKDWHIFNADECLYFVLDVHVHCRVCLQSDSILCAYA